MTLAYPLIVHPLNDLKQILLEQTAWHLLHGNVHAVAALRTVAKKTGIRISDPELEAYTGCPWSVRQIEWAGARRRTSQRRAKGRNLTEHFTTFELLQILTRAGYRCQICGTSERSLTVEHWQPLGEGGANSASNIGITCEACNFGRDYCGDDYLKTITGWQGWE